MQDSQLLEDYVTRNSERAFQSLVARYLNLVRSTALRQVRNASLAEEVAQAVFILLARKAAGLRKRKSLALGGWLYRTTRFVAARALRGELRRQRREQEAFQMQQFSSADETWCRIAPMLDEGIEQLGQTDRDVVILRFFQDEPLHAVGASLGISEEAAGKRVSRSLEKLRSFFVRRGFTISTALLATALAGSRADAAPASLAAAMAAKALAHAASASATAPALVTETLAAWRWAKLKILTSFAAAATAVVFFAAHLWNLPGRAAVDWPGAKPGAKAAPAPLQAAAATRNAADNSWRFSIRAVDALTGKGIPGARIAVVSAKEARQIRDLPQTVDVQTNLQTDAEGRCPIGLAYAEPLMLMVGVWAEGYEERTACGDLDHPLPDGYVLRVPRGVRIGGVVVDESGQPVSGAGIQVLYDEPRSAVLREFLREKFGPPGHGYGIVATTDRAGRWSFGRGSTRRGFRVVANHPDFLIAVYANNGGDGAAPDSYTLKMDDLRAEKAVLVLKAGLTLRGEVTDEHGYRVAGARVCADRVVIEGHGVLTESDGSFVLPVLAPGTNTVTVTANGFAPQRIPVQMASNTAPLVVRLKPGALLRIRVLEESGAPLPGTRLELDRWQQPSTLRWSAVTDSDGRIVWDSAPSDPLTFSARKDGWCGAKNITLIADGQEHTVKLRAPLAVTGHVTDAATKQPIAFFKVRRDPDFAYGSNGQFAINITEYYHEILVLIEANGYEPAISPPMDANANRLTCEIALKRAEAEEAVRGVVVLPDGSPAADVPVALGTSEKPVVLGRLKFINLDDYTATRTDMEGRFFFTTPIAARLVAAVNQNGIGSVLIAGTDRAVSIHLQPWGRIEGVLRLKTQPISGRELILDSMQQPDSGQTVSLVTGVYTTRTDDEGNFAFDQVPPGRFHLYLSGEAIGRSASHVTLLEIQPGATAVVQIGGTGSIVSGRLALSGPEQATDWSKRLVYAVVRTRIPYPPGLSLSARPEWLRQYEQTEEGRARIGDWSQFALDAQSDGSFTVEDVPPGDYEVCGQLLDAPLNPAVGIKGHVIGSFRQEVAVPQPADAASTGKIDMGIVPVQLQGP